MTQPPMTRATPPSAAPLPATRSLPAPGIWSARSWAELLYLLIDFPLAVGTFVAVVVLLAVGFATSVVYIGVPLALGGLLLAKAVGALRRIMAAGLLNSPVPAPGRTPRRRRGFTGMLLDAATEAAAWRAVGYHAVRLCAAPLSLAAVVTWITAWGAVSYSLWRTYLPAQQGADGLAHRGMSFGSGYFVDTPARMLVLAAAGVILLLVAPLVVRGLANMERRLAARLLGPRA